MGRQGGIGTFLGSSRWIVGYVDDGKPLWRQHNPMSKKQWLKHPNFGGQRTSAQYFGAASVNAGAIWSKLPREMRRLADAGGFNRFVGRCFDLTMADGKLWWLDSLSGLDLSADSAGPLKIMGSLEEGYRLTGVRDLMHEIDVAVGPGAGKPSEKYLMAHRFGSGWEVKETVDWSVMGDCRSWRERYKQLRVERRSGTIELRVRRDLSLEERTRALCAKIKAPWGSLEWQEAQLAAGEEALEQMGRVKGSLGHYPTLGNAVRRVRTWLYAVEVGDTEWSECNERFEIAAPCSMSGRGFATEWYQDSRIRRQDSRIRGFAGGQNGGWVDDYRIEGKLELPAPDPDGSGIFVVFAAVEVAEKRGRHWVRLPWCSRMWVHEVIDDGRLMMDDAVRGREYVDGEDELQSGRLVALPGRVVAGADWDFMGCWDFWARWDGWDSWIDWERCGADSDLVLTDLKRGVPVCLDMEGVLCRAGPWWRCLC